jgi:hypothetical protein
MALHLEALWGIVFCVIIFVTMALFAMKIPGGLGMLLGFFTSMIFTITDTIWSIIGPIILPFFNIFKNAVNYGTAMGITMFAAPLIIRGITWVASQVAARFGSSTSMQAYVNWLEGTMGAGVAAAGGRGIISSLKSLGSSLGKSLQGAAVAAVVILASDYLVTYYITPTYGPVAGNAFGGTIEGGTTGWFIGGAIGSVATHGALGGPFGLIVGLPSGLVSNLVKEHSGLQGTAGALATIGSGALTGAAMGAALGLFGGPLCPVTVPIAAGIGAAIGAIVGAFNWFF